MDNQSFVEITVDEATELAQDYLFRLDSYWEPYLTEEIRQEHVRMTSRRFFGLIAPINASATMDDAKLRLERKYDSLHYVWSAAYQTERNSVLDFMNLINKSTTGTVSMSSNMHRAMNREIKD